MCTVIYIPTKDGSLMCSVRDENPNRARAKHPALQQSKEHDFFAPIDGEAGGTWWGVNELGHSIVLLNGAFVNHLPNNRSFRKSRGLIVKELAEQTDLIKHWQELDLLDIEPFTLVVRQNEELFDCRWDGNQKHTRQLISSEAHIWSSAPLYSKEIQQYREKLFADFIRTNPVSIAEVNRFLWSNEEKENGFIMHRFENLRSLSISTFHFHQTFVELTYTDLITDETSSQTLQLVKS